MKRFLLAPVAAAVLAVPALASSATAASTRSDFRREYVAADATLVVHLDIDAFNASTFGKMFSDARANMTIEPLEDLERDLGFDPFAVLHSITIYGAGEDAEAGIAVLRASEKIDDALLKLREDEGFSLSYHDEIEVFHYEEAYGFVDTDGSNRIVVLGNSVESVLNGARVVLGDAKSLRDAEGSMKVEPIDGSFLFVAASDGVPGMDQYEPASQVFGLAKGIQLDLGEAGGSIFAHLAIPTGDADEARDAVDIVQALITLTRLSGAEEAPALKALFYALRVSARGGTVMVDFEYPVEELAKVLQQAMGEGGKGNGNAPPPAPPAKDHSHDDEA